MYIKDIVKITKGYFINLTKNKKINKIKLDSRKLEKNDVFICVGKGINYIDEAIKKNAALIITEEEVNIKTNIGILKVDSIHDTLISLISFIRNKYKYIPLVALTGSVGKTSTKELISNILETKYKVLKNEGNQNNYIGIANTIFNLDKSYDVIVLELGMNHFHEIEELSIALKPDLCAITCIGTSHIGNLGSKRNIFKAKMEIIKGMKKGFLVVPPNDYYLSKLHLPNIEKCYDINIKNLKINDKLSFLLRYKNNEYKILFNIPNKTYINNIIIAFKIARIFDIDINNTIEIINTYNPVNKRMNIIKTTTFTLIDDSYNSSYESLKGVLEYIRKIKKHKIIILGDIKELGSYSLLIHKKINNLLNKIKDKEILLVGEDVKVIKGIHFSSNEELINYLKIKDLNNSIILVKASRIMHFEQIKDYILEFKRI